MHHKTERDSEEGYRCKQKYGLASKQGMSKLAVPELFIFEKRQLNNNLIQVNAFINGKEKEEKMIIYCGFQWQD